MKVKDLFQAIDLYADDRVAAYHNNAFVLFGYVYFAYFMLMAFLVLLVYTIFCYQSIPLALVIVLFTPVVWCYTGRTLESAGFHLANCIGDWFD